MEKVKEKRTAWLETIKSFFAPEEDANEKNSGYEEWKKANADIIDEKAIANLEKMIKDQVKKSGKPKKSGEKSNTKSAETLENDGKELRNRGEKQGGLER